MSNGIASSPALDLAAARTKSLPEAPVFLMLPRLSMDPAALACRITSDGLVPSRPGAGRARRRVFRARVRQVRAPRRGERHGRGDLLSARARRGSRNAGGERPHDLP